MFSQLDRPLESSLLENIKILQHKVIQNLSGEVKIVPHDAFKILQDHLTR
jgi:hypothetical protein